MGGGPVAFVVAVPVRVLWGPGGGQWSLWRGQGERTIVTPPGSDGGRAGPGPVFSSQTLISPPPVDESSRHITDDVPPQLFRPHTRV